MGRVSTVDLLVLTSLDQLVSELKILFTIFTKQPTLMRSSTVQSLPPQLAFTGPVFAGKAPYRGVPCKARKAAAGGTLGWK